MNLLWAAFCLLGAGIIAADMNGRTAWFGFFLGTVIGLSAGLGWTIRVYIKGFRPMTRAEKLGVLPFVLGAAALIELAAPVGIMIAIAGGGVGLFLGTAIHPEADTKEDR